MMTIIIFLDIFMSYIIGVTKIAGNFNNVRSCKEKYMKPYYIILSDLIGMKPKYLACRILGFHSTNLFQTKTIVLLCPKIGFFRKEHKAFINLLKMHLKNLILVQGIIF